MSDFTKGPWVLDSRWTHRVFCDDVTGSLVAITAGDEFNFVGRAKKEANANANLISAAPDMYEALQMIVRAEQLIIPEDVKLDYNGELHALSNMMNNIKMALAKADGKEVS